MKEHTWESGSIMVARVKTITQEWQFIGRELQKYYNSSTSQHRPDVLNEKSEMKFVVPTNEFLCTYGIERLPFRVDIDLYVFRDIFGVQGSVFGPTK